MTRADNQKLETERKKYIKPLKRENRRKKFMKKNKYKKAPCNGELQGVYKKIFAKNLISLIFPNFESSKLGGSENE